MKRGEKDMKVRDKVIVLDKDGNKIGEGTIININEFREPDMMYAVDVVGYEEDYIFCGESQLKLKKEDNIYLFMNLNDVIGDTYYTDEEEVKKIVEESNEKYVGDFWYKTLERKGE